MLRASAGEEIIGADYAAPSLIRRSQRCEPRNPAPPVTSTRVSRCIPRITPDGDGCAVAAQYHRIWQGFFGQAKLSNRSGRSFVFVR